MLGRAAFRFSSVATSEMPQSPVKRVEVIIHLPYFCLLTSLQKIFHTFIQFFVMFLKSAFKKCTFKGVSF